MSCEHDYYHYQEYWLQCGKCHDTVHWVDALDTMKRERDAARAELAAVRASNAETADALIEEALRALTKSGGSFSGYEEEVESTAWQCNHCQGWSEAGETTADIEHDADCVYRRAVAVLATRGGKP